MNLQDNRRILFAGERDTLLSESYYEGVVIDDPTSLNDYYLKSDLTGDLTIAKGIDASEQVLMKLGPSAVNIYKPLSMNNNTLSGVSTLTATTANATTVNATAVNATTLTGTLQTAAQPNITSLGTLTGLTMGGDISMNTNNITGATSISSGTFAAGNGQLTFAGGAGNAKIQGNVSNSGRVGFFNASGTEVLQMPFTSQITIPLGVNLTVDNTLYVDSTNDRVGILTASPAHPLDVAGDINTSTDYNIGGVQVLNATTLGSGVVNSSLTSVGTLTSLSSGLINTTGNFTMTKASPTFNMAGTTEYLRILGSMGINYIQSGIVATTGSAADLFIGNMLQNTASSARKIMFKADGTVGLGTASPAYPLDVVGDINTSTDYNIGGVQVLNSTTLGSGVVNSSLTNVGTLSSLNVGGLTTLGDATNKDLIVFNTERPWKLTAALTGANTTLDLSANTSDKDFRIIDGTSSNVVFKATAHSTASSQKITLCSGGGNVGIGTASPSYPLDVVGDINTSTDYNIGGVQVLNSTTLGSSVVNSSLTSFGTLTSLTISGNLTVDTSTLFVNAANNRVGINTASPSYDLHTIGTIRATNYNTGDNVRFFRSRITTQNVNTGTNTAVNFDLNNKTESDFSYNGTTDAISYTGTSRYFSISVKMAFSSNSTGYRKLTVRRSTDPAFGAGSELIAPIIVSVPAVNGDVTYMTATNVVRLDGSDYLKVQVLQNSGSTLTIAGGTDLISITITAVGEA